MTKPLSAEDAASLRDGDGWRFLPFLLLDHICQVARADHLVIDTATHVAVPKMSETEAQERAAKDGCVVPAEVDIWVDALRSVGVVKP